jgi:methylated-DNA-[protein]-cysteine S-methyltransferase
MTYCIAFDTPHGWLTLESSDKGLKAIKFGKFCTEPRESELLRTVKNDILDYLQGKAVIFHRNRDITGNRVATLKYPIDIAFTTAQVSVFDHLVRVPYGTTVSYKRLAELAGTAPRACGRVNGSNPLPIIIPCHRVIRADGGLGGFGGGLEWKRGLLRLESDEG